MSNSNLSSESDTYFDSTDRTDSWTAPPTIRNFSVMGGYFECNEPEFEGFDSACRFNIFNFKKYNTEMPEIHAPDYPAYEYTIPLYMNTNLDFYDGLNQLRNSYLETVEPDGLGKVSNKKFRTRERLLKFGHKYDQLNLSSNDIINESKGDQINRLRDQDTATRNYHTQKSSEVNTDLTSIRLKINDLNTRVNSIRDILNYIDNISFPSWYYEMTSLYQGSSRNLLHSFDESASYVEDPVKWQIWWENNRYYTISNNQMYETLDNENQINSQKAFMPTKCYSQKLLQLKGKLESEIDILKEEYNRVSRRFRYDLQY